jgi:hypothetical protein
MQYLKWTKARCPSCILVCFSSQHPLAWTCAATQTDSRCNLPSPQYIYISPTGVHFFSTHHTTYGLLGSNLGCLISPLIGASSISCIRSTRFSLECVALLKPEPHCRQLAARNSQWSARVPEPVCCKHPPDRRRRQRRPWVSLRAKRSMAGSGGR